METRVNAKFDSGCHDSKGLYGENLEPSGLGIHLGHIFVITAEGTLYLLFHDQKSRDTQII